MTFMDWDGAERRAVELADQQSKANGHTVEVPMATVIIGFAAMVLLQVAAMWSHVVISNHIDREAERSQEVDRSLTCYVVKVTQGSPAGLQVLSDCGFLPQIPTPGGGN